MKSETTNNNSIKRRKTEQACLSVLPIGILEHTAGFLAAPSRALFAVALSKNTHLPNENPSPIAGSDDSVNENSTTPSGNYLFIAGADDWHTLDFGDIEKRLAQRLSDDDISDILMHINAINKLKRLRLTNCTKISGICLEPLRGSTMIEQIDLSLVGDGKSPVFSEYSLFLPTRRSIDLDPPISCELVLPILDSIIEREGRCALKHLQFPHKWRRRDRPSIPNDSVFRSFILRYHQIRENRDTTVRCLHCNEDLPQDGNRWIKDDRVGVKDYGTHNHICYQCTKHYCYDCSDEDGIKSKDT